MNTALHKMKTAKIIAIIASGLYLIATISPSVLAASLSKDFKAHESLATGTIVSLDEEASVVVKASRVNVHNMYGVVVAEGDISFKGEAADQVPVANQGVVQTLVSTAAGEIKAGDAITVMSVEGIGEKASQNGRMVGVAQADFDEQSTNTKTFSITQNGSKKDIKVGLLSVKLGVTDYTTAASNLGSASEQDRNLLERLADSFAGKQVKPIALFVSGLVLLSGVFIATFLITSSSFASVISIGRNPFARKHIMSSLVGLIVMSVGIFCGSLVLAYLMLKLLG